MIVDVYLRIFNCVFSRAVDLNRCYIKDIIYNTSFILFYFLKKKSAGGFTQDVLGTGEIICYNRYQNIIVYVYGWRFLHQ